MSVNRDEMVIITKQSWCKSCSICVAFCPKKVLGLDNHHKIVMLDEENCIKCGQCELRCPDFAIYLGGKSSE